MKAMTSCLTSRSMSWMRSTSKLGMGAQRGGGQRRDFAGFSQRFAGGQLHRQPLLEAVLVAEDTAHFGTRVAGNHV